MPANPLPPQDGQPAPQTGDEARAACIRQRLHDQLCQQVTAGLLFADALCRSLEQREAPESADARQLLAILQSAADELVTLMQDLGDVPPKIDR